MKRIFLFYYYILTTFLGSFSIRFDEYYEYDGSPINNYPCFQIGSECHLSGECCGVACCVLTSWALRPVCLVPGYKSAFQDILYYNNFSIYNDQTNHKDKEKAETSHSGINVTNKYLSKDSLSLKNVYSSDNSLNFSLEDSFPSEIKIVSTTNHKMQNESIKPHKSKFQTQLKIVLQHQYKFLLLNSTIEQTSSDSNLSKVYEILKNSDLSKFLVTLLQEKLKRLNEEEMLRTQNTEDISSINIQSPLLLKSPPKLSKWKVVREFFLEKDKSKTVTPEINYLKAEEKLNKQAKLAASKSHSKEFKKSEETKDFEDVIDNFYTDSTLNFVSANNENTGTQNAYDEATDDDILEFFNVNLPYNVEQTVSSENAELNLQYTTGKSNKILESTRSEFGDDQVKLKASSKEDKQSKYIEPSRKVVDQPTTKIYSKIDAVPSTKKTVPGKISEKLAKMFIWHKKNKSSEEKKSLVLNEHFILTMNSKNLSKTQSVDLLESGPTDNIKTISDDYSPSYHSSGESVSSETEDLYNNSFVFVMHKRNTTGLDKSTKWDSLLSFFHIAKSIPCPQGKNPCIECSLNSSKLDKYTQTGPQDGDEVVAKNNSVPTTPKIIYLPEGLMPEALEGRQINDTKFMFYEDSFMEDDNKLEERNTSGRFLFFFK